MQRKPIRVFYSVLSQRFYATRAWREEPAGIFIVTGEKFDVTDDIAAMIIKHGIEFRPQETAERSDG